MTDLLEFRVKSVVRSCTREEHFTSCRHWILDLRHKGMMSPILAHYLMEFVDKVELNVLRPIPVELYASSSRFVVPQQSVVL